MQTPFDNNIIDDILKYNNYYGLFNAFIFKHYICQMILMQK